MKKFLIIMVFIFSFFVSYGNNETYKIELTQRLLKNMNLKLDELQSKGKIKTEEILPKFKKDLSQLRDTYKEDDFEYDVIQELINNLTLENSQSPQNQDQNNQELESLDDGQEGIDTQTGRNPDGAGGNGEGGEEEEVQPKGPSMTIEEQDLGNEKELSPEETENIENYLDGLLEEEKQNMHLNKPRDTRDIFDILQDDFGFQKYGGRGNDW